MVRYENALDQVVVDNDSLKEGASPTVAEFLQPLAIYLYCKQAALRVETAIVEYTTEKNTVSVRVAPIDGAVQILRPQAHWYHLLHHSHYRVMAHNSI